MADETTTPQQTEQNSAPPSDEWKAKYEAVVKERDEAKKLADDKDRQYQSVQGNLAQTVTERKKLQDDLKALSDSSERDKGQLLAEKQQLEESIKAKQTVEAQLQTQLAGKESEAEVLKLIITEYPELAVRYSKGLINTTGMDKDALKKHLDEHKADVLVENTTNQRRKGVAPPPPPGGQNSMTFQQVQDAKVEALKQHGARSQEFKELVALEDQLFKEGKYK